MHTSSDQDNIVLWGDFVHDDSGLTQLEITTLCFKSCVDRSTMNVFVDHASVELQVPVHLVDEAGVTPSRAYINPRGQQP